LTRRAGDPDTGRLLAEIDAALDLSGLKLRGGFAFQAGEAAPPGPSGLPARSLLIVGQVGAAPWPHFQRWLSQQPARPENPFDRFAIEMITAVAERFEARAVSPSDRPYLPFQRWAMRAEGLRPSPLGILMHPEFGLWHAYRGALLFDRPLTLPEPQAPIHLCEACHGKPCLKACPVNAHTVAGFAHQNCSDHVRSSQGSACRMGGCIDRNACPEGGRYRYPAEVQAFHMAAFAGAV
jgi:ferredoxin